MSRRALLAAGIIYNEAVGPSSIPIQPDASPARSFLSINSALLRETERSDQAQNRINVAARFKSNPSQWHLAISSVQLDRKISRRAREETRVDQGDPAMFFRVPRDLNFKIRDSRAISRNSDPDVGRDRWRSFISSGRITGRHRRLPYARCISDRKPVFSSSRVPSIASRV
jgi:hypothetical protein